MKKSNLIKMKAYFWVQAFSRYHKLVGFSNLIGNTQNLSDSQEASTGTKLVKFAFQYKYAIGRREMID